MAVVAAACRIIEDVERLSKWTRASAAGKAGRIVVGFYKSLSAGGFRSGLREFREQHPDIDVETPANARRRNCSRSGLNIWSSLCRKAIRWPRRR